MHRLAWLLIIGLATTALAAPKLGRSKASQRIAEFAFARLDPDAIEIRHIPQQGDRALVEATIALALQFRKNADQQWLVDAIRLGDREWIAAAELAAAAGVSLPLNVPAHKAATVIDPMHVHPTEAEAARQRMNELGSAPLIAKAIHIRRVISLNDTRTTAEATVTLSFRFKPAGTADWVIEAARAGDGNWFDTVRLTATLNEQRRQATLQAMKLLAAGIERYVLEDGSLPAGKDMREITDVLHPLYMQVLVQDDGWGRPMEYTFSGFTFRLLSLGADGLRGTADDIIFP